MSKKIINDLTFDQIWDLHAIAHKNYDCEYDLWVSLKNINSLESANRTFRRLLIAKSVIKKINERKELTLNQWVSIACALDNAKESLFKLWQKSNNSNDYLNYKNIDRLVWTMR